jgi:hypothetical protein
MNFLTGHRISLRSKDPGSQLLDWFHHQSVLRPSRIARKTRKANVTRVWENQEDRQVREWGAREEGGR